MKSPPSQPLYENEADEGHTDKYSTETDSSILSVTIGEVSGLKYVCRVINYLQIHEIYKLLSAPCDNLKTAPIRTLNHVRRCDT